MHKRFIYLFLLILLLTDLSFSFVQHLSMPLDGDMAGGIVPALDVKPVLSDPFGTSVILEKAFYPNPNRYFAHFSFYKYFNTIPVLLQSFVSTIDSVYLACAIAKIITQFTLISLLAFLITGKIKLFSFDFLLVSVLISPLLQTNGYRSFMGIIDTSITYSFFYALPCVLLLYFIYLFSEHPTIT